MKRYKVPFILLITIILSFSSIHAAANILLPNELNIIAGKINEFSFNIPLEAEFSAEAADAVNINNAQVKDNINIDLAKPCNIEASETGKYNVQLSFLGIIPLKKVTVTALPETLLIPSGLSVGVNLSTKGIMVLGTGFVEAGDGINIEPAKNILKSGDIILEVSGNKIETKKQLINYVEQSNGNPLELTINRNSEIINTKITAIKDAGDQKYKIGVWARDSTGGIGTMTYYNPETKTFGALGHGIVDVDTKQLMTIKEGSIMESSVNSVHKGAKGTPGELLGNIYKEKKIGSIEVNTPYGIYGYLEKTDVANLPNEKMPIGLKQEVHEGDAHIKCNVDGSGVKDYSIVIESINKFSSNETKGMIVRITDKELIEKTGGIVQGMSGSPIIQDGKIVGAVTHVFVQDPTKGYGIFIENMLKYEKSIEI